MRVIWLSKRLPFQYLQVPAVGWLMKVHSLVAEYESRKMLWIYYSAKGREVATVQIYLSKRRNIILCMNLLGVINTYHELEGICILAQLLDKPFLKARKGFFLLYFWWVDLFLGLQKNNRKSLVKWKNSQNKKESRNTLPFLLFCRKQLKNSKLISKETS